MKTIKSLTVTVLACASLIFVACAKKDDNNGIITAGTLQTDGVKITSNNSTVMNSPLTLTIANISNSGAVNNTAYYNQGNNGATVGFDMTLNGANLRLSSPIMTNMGQFSAWQTVGQFSVMTGSVCVDAACNEVIVDIAIGLTNSDYNTATCKEIDFKRNNSQNKITALKEMNIPCVQLKTFNEIRTLL